MDLTVERYDWENLLTEEVGTDLTDVFWRNYTGEVSSERMKNFNREIRSKYDSWNLLLERDDRVIHVARTTQGKVVGFLEAKRLFEGFTRIVWIMVDIDFRRMGIASKLNRVFEEECRQGCFCDAENSTKVQLSVYPKNDGAIELYRKWGFREICREEEYISMLKVLIKQQDDCE